MITKKAAVGLSSTVLIIALVHACQRDRIQETQTPSTGQTEPTETNPPDAQPIANKPNTGANTGSTPTIPVSFTMTWDVSPDPSIISYKIFIVPPDQNIRFKGKTDVPIQIKNYPIAGLKKIGSTYSAVISRLDIKTSLGSLVVNPAAYCFTVVAVSAVGNSTHSPVVCP